MAAVRAGVGREAAHEAIKEHAVAVALAMREQGAEGNDLLDRLAADPRLGLSRDELDALVADPLAFTGAAAAQVAAVVAKVEAVAAEHPRGRGLLAGADPLTGTVRLVRLLLLGGGSAALPARRQAPATVGCRGRGSTGAVDDEGIDGRGGDERARVRGPGRDPSQSAKKNGRKTSPIVYGTPCPNRSATSRHTTVQTAIPTSGTSSSSTHHVGRPAIRMITSRLITGSSATHQRLPAFANTGHHGALKSSVDQQRQQHRLGGHRGQCPLWLAR